ncbi:V-type ATP synthase subunit K [Candidatus Calescamantes bacterium]|nr:V-type ATP synthase subunit K [Candidatus Calescamantes bacterium]
MGLAWALAGMFLAVVLSGIGSANGIGTAGQAAAGALTETSEHFGKYLILVALPGTQGIYGFAIAFLLLLKLQQFSYVITPEQGWYFFFAALPVGFAGLFSAIYQGRVCAAGIMLTGKQPKESAKSLILAAIVEFYAILGFVISFFAWLWPISSLKIG